MSPRLQGPPSLGRTILHLSNPFKRRPSIDLFVRRRWKWVGRMGRKNLRLASSFPSEEEEEEEEEEGAVGGYMIR